MGDYKDLLVWQKAMDFAESICRVTHSFPRDEVYGLTSQIRRSAVSIPSNIAEGSSRGGKKEFIQFLTNPTNVECLDPIIEGVI